MKKLLIIILFKSIFVFSIFASFNVSEIEKRVFENINQIDISNIGKVKQLNNSLDSLISLNKDNRGNYQIEKLKLYNKTNKYSKSLRLALNIYEKNEQDTNFINCNNKIYLNYYLSKNLALLGHYTKAITHLENNKKSPCFESDIYTIINYQIAELYAKNNKDQKAIEYLNNYINTLIQNNDSVKLIGAYNQLGLIASNVSYNSLAIHSYKKAIKVIDNTKNRLTLKPIIQGNIGHVYFIEKKYALAKKYLKKDIIESLKNKDAISHISAKIEFSKIEMITNKHKAVISLNEILYNQKNLSAQFKLNIYELLSENYRELEDLKKSIIYINKYYSLKDSLDAIYNLKQKILINEYSKSIYTEIVSQLKNKNEIANNKLLLSEKEKKLKYLQNGFLYFILLMFILILFLIISRINLAKKSNAKILEAQILMKDQENKIQKTQKNLLEIQIKNNKKDIQSLSLELNFKQDLSKKIIDKLSEFKNVHISDLRSFELFINNELDLKSNRAKLQKDIDSLGEKFFKNITVKHPNLTNTDLKLCTLIVLNLVNKEIAISKNISTNSVKVTKNRLKKKLNLNTEVDLKEYLNDFLL